MSLCQSCPVLFTLDLELSLYSFLSEKSLPRRILHQQDQKLPWTCKAGDSELFSPYKTQVSQRHTKKKKSLFKAAQVIETISVHQPDVYFKKFPNTVIPSNLLQGLSLICRSSDSCTIRNHRLLGSLSSVHPEVVITRLSDQQFLKRGSRMLTLLFSA